ncbi:hypothetical protein RBB50_011103 [Rhinocladiella similis]
MSSLASARSCQGKYEEADEMLRATLKLRKTVLGEEHPETLASMNNLAYLLALRSRFVQAAILFERAEADISEFSDPIIPPRRRVRSNTSFQSSRVIKD